MIQYHAWPSCNGIPQLHHGRTDRLCATNKANTLRLHTCAELLPGMHAHTHTHTHTHAHTWKVTIPDPAPKNLVMEPWPSLSGPSSKSEAATARRVQGMASGHFWNSLMTVSHMTGAVGPAFRNLGMGHDLLRSPLPHPPPPPPLKGHN